MKRVFVFEYLTGASAIDADDGAANELFAMGLAMRDAVVLDLLHSENISVSIATNAAAPALPGHPPGARNVCALKGESTLEFLARQSALHDLSWIVAPETGGLLAQFQRAVGARCWLGCDAASIVLAASKRATSRRLAGRDVATPWAFRNSPDVTRWVVKPDDGAGAVGTQVHTSRSAALADAGSPRRAGAVSVIEPWVEGEPLSLSLLCKHGSAELLSINRQCIHIDAQGIVSFSGVEINVVPLAGERGRALQRLADAVVHAIPGLHGFVGIDLVWHPQRGPVVIEVNPRVTCAYVGLSAALGRNLAAELVAGHAMARSDAAAHAHA